MKIWLFTFSAALLILGCSTHKDDESNVFRYNESNGITTLDPAFARDLEIMWATNQIFDGLVEMSPTLEVTPCIASRWEISADGLTYTFFLRKNVLFHESEFFSTPKNRSVVASDFVYSFNRIIDPSLASPGSWIFSQVDTASTPFEAPNDSTFIIHLKKPFQPFLGMLTTQYCNVVPKEVVAHYGKDFRSHPIGTGPFQFAFWYENNALVFHKNKSFWQKDENGNALPFLDAIKIDFVKDVSVEFHGLLLDKYDFISGIHPAFKDELLTSTGELVPAYEDKLQMIKTPFIKTDYIGFYIDEKTPLNADSPFLLQSIRKAVNCAIDKKEMVKYLRNNTVVAAENGFLPPSLLNDEQAQKDAYNPALALEILKQAGFPNGKGLPKLVIATTSDYTDLIEFIQHNLSKVGISVEVQVMQGSTFREATAKGQLPAFRKSWLADYPDPENFLSIFTSKNYCPSGPNYTHYNNTQYDQWYEEAIQTNDDSLRTEIYKKMNRQISQDYPVIPLYYDQVTHFISKRVDNWEINPINLIDLKKVKKLN